MHSIKAPYRPSLFFQGAIYVTWSWCADLQDPLPWYPSMSSRNIVLRLSSQEASDVFFRELVLLLGAVAATTSSATLRPIAEEILQPVAMDTGVHQDAAGLHMACRCVSCLLVSLCGPKLMDAKAATPVQGCVPEDREYHPGSTRQCNSGRRRLCT